MANSGGKRRTAARGRAPRPAERPRLKDIAQMTGVSISTASMALAGHPDINAQTRKRVLQTSRRLGYRKPGTPPRGSQFRARHLGLLIIGGDLHNAASAHLVVELSGQAAGLGVRIECSAVPVNVGPEETARRTLAFAKGLEGLLLLDMVDPALIARLKQRGVPAVVMGHTVGEPGGQGAPASVVGFDDTRMGYTATRWMLDAGHRKIAFVAEFTVPGLSHDRWLRGYRMALLDAGLNLEAGLVQLTGRPEGGAGPAVEALYGLPAGQRPTAYVVPDTRIAATLVAALQQRGVRLAARALAFNGMRDLVKAMGLGGFPHVVGRGDLLARHAIRQLLHACDNPTEPPVEILVPFEAFNAVKGAGRD